MERKPNVFHTLLIAFALIGIACDKEAIIETPKTCGASESNNLTQSENASDDLIDCGLPVDPPKDDVSELPDELDAPDPPQENFEQAPQADLEINAYLRDFSSTQEDKMESALEKLNIVLNSEEFRIKVLNHQYNGINTFVDNNGQSNLEVYYTILKGAEVLNGIIDQEVDIDITLYYSNNSTVGYTYPNVDRIWVNDKFFATYNHGSVAANVVHEWLHKLGYGHDFDRTIRRNYSVPYAIGSIVRELVNKL